MSTSGTRQFTPDFADLLSEAFSRVRVRPETVVEEHIKQAILSANLMLVELAGAGIEEFALTETIITLVDGTSIYNLPAGTVDVWYGIVRKANNDTPIWPISRDDFTSIPNKTTKGRPLNFFVDRSGIGETTRTITFWPVPGTASADTVRLWVWRRPEAILKIGNDIGVSWEWLDCYAAGLAKRLAVKYAPDLEEKRAQEFGRAIVLAKRLGRNRAPTRIRATGYLRRGRRV